MADILKTHPAVFGVHDNYQIFVPVTCETLMWVKVGDECFYDDSNGILRSKKNIHSMNVPKDILDKAGKYTICFRKIIERKPYYSETEDICEAEYDFYPANGDSLTAFHIADAHNMIDAPVSAAKFFEKETGKRLDFLIMNGDVPDHSGTTDNFDNIYEIISQITGGNIPVVYARGNHDTRGICAELMEDYTPTYYGNTYFTFRLGNIWGLVLDCGEDKPDCHEAYGSVNCFHDFRKRETAFLESLTEKADSEYNADGIAKKIIVCHAPFTRKNKSPFDIEEDTYTYWAKLLSENVKPDIMICGHTHKLSFDMPGCENDAFGQPCPIVVGSEPERTLTPEGNKFTAYKGAGFVFTKNEIKIIFCDKDTVYGEHTIKSN